jgi:hypothetical protein
MRRALLLFLLLFLNVACQEQKPLTGHREIAAAIRNLLDKAYPGIDYLTYRDSLKEVETIMVQQLKMTPVQLRDQAGQMLAYLRVAEEVLRWQQEHGGKKPTARDHVVATWIERYPFLRPALGAHETDIFDPQTATTLLWDKTDEILRGFQVKSRPL